jgi:hypothetical protein
MPSRDDAGMMTQQLDVCVLAAPLAAIDRRALSQAWYSALHCASVKPNSASPPKRNGSVQTETGRAADASPSRTTGRARRAAATLVHNGKTNDRGLGVAGERRALRSPLARRMERAFFNPRSPAQRATFVTGGKRVHVMVQASEGRVRFVAVCPPSIKATVAGALAQARFALASRGIACS